MTSEVFLIKDYSNGSPPELLVVYGSDGLFAFLREKDDPPPICVYRVTECLLDWSGSSQPVPESG